MDLVRFERHGRVGHVVLNRPEKINALSRDLLAQLRETWREVAADSSVRVAILRGEGRGFSAGADLTQGRAPNAPPEGDVVADRQGILDGLLGTCLMAWDLPKPVIAQVHGYCFAGGTLLALYTDMIFIAEDTVVGWPKVPVGGGLIGPSWSWMVGPYRAKEFSLTVGHTFSGAQAVAMGWGNRAVPADRLAQETQEAAEKIAKLSSDLIAIKKAAVNKQMDARGFRTGIMHGAEMDAIAHTTHAVHVAREQIRARGLKGAIDWFQQEGIP